MYSTKQKMEEALASGPSEIVALVSSYFESRHNVFDGLYNVFLSSAYPMKDKLSFLSEEKLFSLVMLCLAYSAINPNLIGTPIIERYKTTVFDACSVCGLDSSLIAPVSSVEMSLYQVLDQSEL